jgi:alpha-D-ribose 1-methylphosphonate 5-triphosphate synthase subunit PhnL
MEPLLENGVDAEVARERAVTLLTALRLPPAHWDLPPATFSGGEQQRVNIARSFIRDYPVMLLDEPTASLDAENRAIVVALIKQALGRGAAMIGIFHDQDVRDAVATRLFPVAEFKAVAA